MNHDRASHLQRIIARMLAEDDHLNDSQSAALSSRIFRVVCEELGPGDVYIPSPRRLQRSEQDAAIYAAFNGRNRDAVCERFEIEHRAFYRAISRERERRRTAL